MRIRLPRVKLTCYMLDMLQVTNMLARGAIWVIFISFLYIYVMTRAESQENMC